MFIDKRSVQNQKSVFSCKTKNRNKSIVKIKNKDKQIFKFRILHMLIKHVLLEYEYNITIRHYVNENAHSFTYISWVCDCISCPAFKHKYSLTYSKAL